MTHDLPRDTAALRVRLRPHFRTLIQDPAPNLHTPLRPNHYLQ